jgi:glycosyltransferase involved in cell wall biosynthesis
MSPLARELRARAPVDARHHVNAWKDSVIVRGLEDAQAAVELFEFHFDSARLSNARSNSDRRRASCASACIGAWLRQREKDRGLTIAQHKQTSAPFAVVRGVMSETYRGARSVRSLAMLGNHLPRQCGIATFTTDLSNAIEREATGLTSFVLAMNDVVVKHAYPPRVRFEIPEGDIEAYRRAAVFLNVNSVDVVSVQHEYGIFGGKAGSHVLELLRDLRMPIVTTLHTILKDPDVVQRETMNTLLNLSERVVVMSDGGAKLLREVHGADVDKLDVIPHGIPSAPERQSKDRLGVEGRHVILTFGLLSPDKGLEYVIDAMPAILAKHPNTIYIVLGATHPHVKQQHGEAYRQMLQTRAVRLGVDASVVFHNRFVSHEELVEFLGAADLYVTPYLKEEQSTSGTLAYAIGCGKAVVSTPYRYARELLSGDRGVLVPWRESEAIGREISSLLSDPKKREDLQQRAAAYGRQMAWPVVARRYIESFERAHDSYDIRRRAGLAATSLAIAKHRPEFPEIDLSHVKRMTDDTGMLQHAVFDIPRYRDGYCLDDNARALLLMTHVEDAGIESPSVVQALATRYLAFMNFAFDEESGTFKNFMSYERTFHERTGSDDSHGRALWALGAVVGRTRDPGRRGLSARLFHGALAPTLSLTSPRAWAYALLGIDEYLRAFEGDSNVGAVRSELAAKLVLRYRHTQSSDWPWFEDRLTYGNARLSQALLVTAARVRDAEMARIAETSLSWLVGQHSAKDGSFVPVGTNGFYVRGGERARFDQQPVEACAMVSACLDAHRITDDGRWLSDARRAFQWFLGQNSLEEQVYDARTGGCRDGIHADRMNENQGAESTLSFLTALAEMRAADKFSAKPRTQSSLQNTMARGANGAPPSLADRGVT